MIREVAAPWPGVRDERLHDRALRLDDVHEVVRGPLVEELAQGDGAEFGVASRAIEVRLGHRGQERQALDAQGGVAFGQGCRVRLGGDRGRLRVGIVARKLGLAGQDRADAGREDGSLGVGGVAEALESGLLARCGRTQEELAVEARREGVPPAAVDAEDGDRAADQVGHGDRSYHSAASRRAGSGPPVSPAGQAARCP